MGRNEEQWLIEIRESIGASAVGGVLGLTDWQTPLQLHYWYTGELERAPFKAADPEVYHDMEIVIDRAYQRATGRQTRDLGRYTIQTNARYPQLHATLDREIRPCEGHDMAGCLELKTSHEFARKLWDDGPPLAYQAQLQTQLLVTGCTWGSIAVIFGGHEHKHWDYAADPDIQKWILAKTESFWQGVKGKIPPPPTHADSDTLKRLFPEHDEGESVDLPAESAAWTQELVSLNDTLGVLTKRKQELRNLIAAKIGAAGVGLLPNGMGRWTIKTVAVDEHIVHGYTRPDLRMKLTKGE